LQGDHLSGKPGNVGELYRCQGNVRNFTKSHGNVREKILSWKIAQKLSGIVFNILCKCHYRVQRQEIDKQIAELKAPK